MGYEDTTPLPDDGDVTTLKKILSRLRSNSGITDMNTAPEPQDTDVTTLKKILLVLNAGGSGGGGLQPPVANSDLAVMAEGTVKANLMGGSATPQDVTLADLAAALGGGGSALTGNVAWVDAVNGVDATGAVGDLSKPYRTITAALAAVAAGQVVAVLPGAYTDTGMGKSNVSLVLYPGVSFAASTTTLFTLGASVSGFSVVGFGQTIAVSIASGSHLIATVSTNSVAGYFSNINWSITGSSGTNLVNTTAGGTVNLSGNFTCSSSTTFAGGSAGLINITGNITGLGSIASGVAVIMEGNLYDTSFTGTSPTIAGTLTLLGDIDYASSVGLSITGTMTSIGSINVSTLTVSGVLSHTGSLNSGGNLSFTNAISGSNIYGSVTGNITSSSGGTVRILGSAYSQSNATLSVTGGGTLEIDGFLSGYSGVSVSGTGTSVRIGGIISASGTVTNTGTGTVTIGSAVGNIFSTSSTGTVTSSTGTEVLTKAATDGSTQVVGTLGRDVVLVLTGTGTFAALTTTLPPDANSRLGQQVTFVYEMAVTALTINGGTILGESFPITVGAGFVASFVKIAANTWSLA